MEDRYNSRNFDQGNTQSGVILDNSHKEFEEFDLETSLTSFISGRQNVARSLSHDLTLNGVLTPARCGDRGRVVSHDLGANFLPISVPTNPEICDGPEFCVEANVNATRMNTNSSYTILSPPGTAGWQYYDSSVGYSCHYSEPGMASIQQGAGRSYPSEHGSRFLPDGSKPSCSQRHVAQPWIQPISAAASGTPSYQSDITELHARGQQKTIGQSSVGHYRGEVQIKQETDGTNMSHVGGVDGWFKMSLWEKTMQLSRDAFLQVQSAYNNGFPIDIRHYFASWIEEQAWTSLDVENSAHEEYAVQILQKLIELTQNKAEEPDIDFLTKVKLQNIAKQLEDIVSSNPMALVRTLTHCLDLERRLVSMQENVNVGMDSGNAEQSQNQDIQRQFEALQTQTNQTEEELKQMQHKQEKFVIDYQTHMKLANQLEVLKSQNQTGTPQELEVKLTAQKQQMDQQLLAAAQELLRRRLALATKHMESVIGLETLQKIVVDGELINWKRRQQLAGNGAPLDAGMLNRLQKWCEDLAEMIWRTRHQVIKVDMLRQNLPIDVPQGHQDMHPELNQKITGLLSTLVTSTFVVETQPPQVLKREARFTTTVRLLVGGKLNIQMSSPEVKANIISESQARALLANDAKAKEQNSGTILNNKGTMEYHMQTGELSITFRNMQLKKIVRSDKKGSEMVADEKFCILFQSDFNIGGNEIVFQVWTLSLPVVVTVHGNQECNAMATVLWDNQFAEPSRTPFQVPDSVKWPDLAHMLSTKYKAVTGRELSEQNINYLASKVFGPAQDYSQHMISRHQFNKESIQGRSFTFWEWFYAVMKLTQHHLRGPWNDDSIIGFISKSASQDMLLSKPNGTFLLRFSESEIGGITIAWVCDDVQNPGERLVWNLAPFTSRDFSIRSLSDRIKDLHSLVTLYPGRPKDEAFGRYYSTVPESPPGITKDGYIRSTLINTIPSIPQPLSGIMSYDNPQTPQPNTYSGPNSPASLSSMATRADTSAMDTLDENCDFADLLTDYTAEEINIDVNQLFERMLSSQPQ